MEITVTMTADTRTQAVEALYAIADEISEGCHGSALPGQDRGPRWRYRVVDPQLLTSTPPA